MRRMYLFWPLVGLLLFLSACVSLIAPPTVACETGDCPNGSLCDPQTRLCVPLHQGAVSIEASLPPHDGSSPEPRPEEIQPELPPERGCRPGEQRDCAIGSRLPPGCNNGIETCLPEGIWGSCQIFPSLLDGGCLCNEGDTISCYNGISEPSVPPLPPCQSGIRSCQKNRTFGKCEGQVLPDNEECDGLDNDCDGKVDETFPTEGQDCTVPDTFGPCVEGRIACLRGAILCLPKIGASTEICDGKDNDCDGQTDEGITRPCYNSKVGCIPQPNGTFDCTSPCKAGTETCTQGKWETCQGEEKPQTEICDVKDNDCDGSVDEGLQEVCGLAVGECKQGIRTCSAGMWSLCTGGQAPTAEICDGKDNDCDGSVDEKLTCSCSIGQTRACGSSIGECKPGSQTCLSSGEWDSCQGQIAPSVEHCDNKDNDCDGKTDEDVTQPCPTLPSGGCKTEPSGAVTCQGLCTLGFQICQHGVWQTPCQKQIAPTIEICDDQDNDCDGSVDEKLTRSCYTGAAGTQDVGLCKAGTQVCSKGSWGECTGQTLPTSEICNGKDDDCNGKTDDGIFCPCIPFVTPDRSCYTGPTGTQGTGECKAGTQKCLAAGWGECRGQTLPTSEICDGKDNDCNGKTDDLSPLSCTCQASQNDTLSGERICRSLQNQLQEICQTKASCAVFVQNTCIAGEYACLGLSSPLACVPLAPQRSKSCQRDLDCRFCTGFVCKNGTCSLSTPPTP